MKFLPVPLLFLLFLSSLRAQSPSEVRSIPPPGIAIPENDRTELTAGVEALRKEIAASRLPANELPNVEIFLKAVDWALRYDEIFDLKQVAIARDQLAQGHARLTALNKGETPWNSASGLVVRGYRSKIDGSIQPYGLVIPPDWKPNDGKKWRLDFWLHGRAEKLSELAFIDERQRSNGEFAPEDAIVCHLYGRFCNANKFAGERDLFEALEDLKKSYSIDDQRLVVRGFSMGGAACWQFATHHSGMWAVAAPGAGFAETAEFFKSFAPRKTPPPWWEQVLWRWYDCTTLAGNLFNVPTVAYSGELDGQKQAADIMVKYAQQEGIEFPHIIGPQTAHKYHPEAKPKIEEFVTTSVSKGRDPDPRKVRLTTYTLIYPRREWLRIEGMIEQWERAEVTAEVDGTKIVVQTKNVSALQVTTPFATGLGSDSIKSLVLDGQILPAVWTKAGLRFRRDGTVWGVGPMEDKRMGRAKDPAICGPIDHAFMARFVFVEPTGAPLNESVGQWAVAELAHAKKFWRQVFRGDASVVRDDAVSDDLIKNANLVLWGDPSSNAVLKKIAERLPIQWSKDTLVVNGVKYDATHHAPIFIFPNPLNPERYVVINSGPTFREKALLNNSDQTPKLPDWAVVDLRTPPDAQWPGLVVDAGFFDEQWSWRK